ncbi:MAG: ROK family protein [Candidatus Nomurabacteria bacterium]|nr:ROK family protein [Candidatus Nomurabacteria bacterium]USN87485.1 MAG: ROK family protein [Candidatus Nomurabacteria bacterium]
MYIIFDIGGTKTRVAASEDLKTYGTPLKFDTPLNYGEAIAVISKAIEEVSQGKEIKGMAGGIRGRLRRDKSGLMGEVVLTDWVDKPLVDDLSKKFGAPVFIENDTAIVGLGEAVFGAGHGYDIVAYHTVSTGVGGARLVGGKVDVASIGFEPGHQILDLDQSIFGKETLHTLENLVSGTALQDRRGVKPYEIDQSDPVWDELAYYLAVGLRNTILYWSPDAIVLGGSMVVGDPRIFREDIIKHTEKVLDGFVPCPPILDATLKDEGGLYGAIALLSEKLGK